LDDAGWDEWRWGLQGKIEDSGVDQALGSDAG
jgi:hypothetical protein